jgi:molybdopterin synthase catalytic subunit/molybdopterin synthase sulfur carrier subunit
MTVRVLLFAAAREAVGANDVQVQLQDNATFGDLRMRLLEAYPQVAQVVARANFAANERYVDEREMVPCAAEVALIPPVSGG